MARDEQIDEPVKAFVAALQGLIAGDRDSHATFKALEDQIKEFNKQRKGSEAAVQSEESTGVAPA